MKDIDDDEGTQQREAPVANAAPDGVATGGPPPATTHRTIHMIGATHIDPVWLWPWQEGYQEARATFSSVIQLMEEYPDFVFTCDQVVLLSWVEEQDPELFERIRKRVAEGRWVNAGGWWVEPDCNMPMGESLVRQGLYGQRWLISRFGQPATVGMNVDPFGHCATLPMILRGQGMDSYMFLRPGPHESDLEDTLFNWRSPDGTTVLAYRIPHEYCSPPGPIDYHVEKALGIVDRHFGDAMVLYGVGNHGGGPTRANIDSIHRFDAMGSFGKLVLSSPRRWFDEVLARGDDFLASLPTRSADLQRHAAGCYSAHSGIKAWQQRAQNVLLSAERWAVVASVLGGVEYPRSDLEKAWKQVLFNQFHDILPGTAIEHAYDDARDELGAATATGKHVIARAHNVIARQIDIPFEFGTQPIVVFNPHPWPVVSAVEFHYGYVPGQVHVVDGEGRAVVHQGIAAREATNTMGRRALVFEADVPPLGWATYRVRPGVCPSAVEWSAGPSQRLRTGTSVLENDRLRAEFDPATGALSSLVQKSTGIDVLAGTRGAPHTQVCVDPTDTWGHRVVSYAWPGAEMQLRAMELVEEGPLLARLRVELVWGQSTLTEDFVLTHDADSLRADVTLDWREKQHLLKLRFPTGLAQPRATHEIPFAEVERPVDGAEQPGQGWADLTGVIVGEPAGLTVVVTNKHGWDFSPGPPASIGVTVVRSPAFAWHDPLVLAPGDRHNHQDQGLQRFSYELVPHAGDRHAVGAGRRSAVLGMPVRAMVESSHDGPLARRGCFASDGCEGVRVTAIKGAEDPASGPGGTDLIVRAVETRGRRTAARIELILLGRVIEEEFGPFQLRTFRVPADPAQPVVEVDLVERTLAPDEGRGEDGPPQVS